MSAKEGKQALPLPGGYLVLAQKCPKMACPGLLAPECLGQPPRLDVGALEDLPGQAPAGGGGRLRIQPGRRTTAEGGTGGVAMQASLPALHVLGYEVC